MKQALGFIEYKSIARGLMATDQMLKSGHVELIQAAVLCPGKFIALVTGDVGAVEAAVENGFRFDTAFAISKFILPNAHPSVFPALMATTGADIAGSLGIIETVDASSAVVAVTWRQKPPILNYWKYGWPGYGRESICLPMW